MTAERQRLRVTAEHHVRRYSALVGRPLDLSRVLPGGRALEIVDADNRRSVLKWDDDEGSKARRRQAIGVAQRLGMAAGWPVPSFELVEGDGWLYVCQSLMPGAELMDLTEESWRQVLELTESTAGLGRGEANDWPHRLIDTLISEPSQPTVYCSHVPLGDHSEAGRRLIERIEDIGAASVGADLGTADDLIHWDLHPGNLLVVDGRISAVIDLDNAGPGPRGFDLITFALAAQSLPGRAGEAAAMLEEARGRVPETLVDAAIAHLILRFSNWALRTGQVEVADHWIARGQRLLLE